MSNVKSTTNFSILIQIIIGLITFNSIFLKLGDEDKILIEILKIETVVQLIELCFYIIILKNMSEKEINKMASIRYFDWFITTPTMLLTSIIYFQYEEYKEKECKKDLMNLTLISFIKENKENIIFIMICNFLMLLFGYLSEINYLDKTIGFIIGFIFFYLSFNNIYKYYAKKSKRGIIVYYFLLIIWSLYGFAFILNSEQKNISYNILDILSKNFFGLYLYYIANSVKIIQ
jgi:bacteriorhodopsin